MSSTSQSIQTNTTGTPVAIPCVNPNSVSNAGNDASKATEVGRRIFGADPSATNASGDANSTAADGTGFVDRRRQPAASDQRSGPAERRQFGSSHSDLSEEGRQLALAIDRYKVENHRRYLTCDELIGVLHQLGYSQSEQA